MKLVADVYAVRFRELVQRFEPLKKITVRLTSGDVISGYMLRFQSMSNASEVMPPTRFGGEITIRLDDGGEVIIDLTDIADVVAAE